MSRLLSAALLVLGAAALASAQTRVPEIDPGSGMNVLALLAGSVIVLRSRFKK